MNEDTIEMEVKDLKKNVKKWKQRYERKCYDTKRLYEENRKLNRVIRDLQIALEDASNQDIAMTATDEDGTVIETSIGKVGYNNVSWKDIGK